MPKKTLLIADDDRLMHEIYHQVLGDGYEYLHAYNGVDALAMAIDLLPDLVILDVVMPGLDGRDVCKKIKSSPQSKAIRVIIVSGKNDQSDRLVGFEAGADDYLEKPYHLDALARIVEKQLRPPP